MSSDEDWEPPIIPSKSTFELREIVRDFLTERIMFACQLEQSMLDLSLVPVALGGMGYPVERTDRKTPKPIPPASFVEPLKPLKVLPINMQMQIENLTKVVTDAVDNLNDVQYKHRWDDATDDDLAVAQTALDNAFKTKEAILMEAENSVKAINDANEHAYQLKMEAYYNANRQYKDDIQAWEEREASLFAEWEGKASEWTRTLEDQLGMVYGYLDDTTPRIKFGQNSKPFFRSIHRLNKADWERVSIAIEREMRRFIDV